MTDEQAVRFESQTIRTDGCWHWTGSLRNGYGRMKAFGRFHEAHRLSYGHFVGPIPVGLELDHLCRNRSCVNPAHLEPVTRRVNVLRGESPAADNANKTHCHKGHPLSGDNLRVRPAGGRMVRSCRTCNREYLRVYDANRPRAIARREAACV